MSILEHLSQSFPPLILERGDEYFDQRRAQIIENRPDYLRAIVRGSGRYRVEIRWHDGDPLHPEFRCGCPYFDEHTECKHVWAVLRQAEHQKLLPSLPNGNGNGHSHDDDEDQDDWEAEQAVEDEIAGRKNGNGHAEGEAPRTRPRWQRALDDVRDNMLGDASNIAASAWPANRRILYIVSVSDTTNCESVVVELMTEDVIAVGKTDRLKPLRISRTAMPKLPNTDDAEIVQMLAGASKPRGGADNYIEIDSSYQLPDASAEALLRKMIATGRCRVRHRDNSSTLPTLQFDDSAPWTFVLKLVRDPKEELFWMRGEFRRGEEVLDASESAIVLRGGLILRGDTIARLDDGGAFDLIELIRGEQNVFIPEAQLPQVMAELFSLPRLPKLELPEGFALAETRTTPKPRLTIARPRGEANRLSADLVFEYDGVRVPARPALPAMYDPASGKLIWRDRTAEITATELLGALGLRPGESVEEPWRLPSNRLGKVVSTLVGQNWIVEAEGKIYRRGGKFNVRVSSGIDWLELTGGIDFDGQVATMPQLLAAARSGDKLVKLGDGTFGVLPDEWLAQYGLLAALGDADGDQIKFSKKQVGLLDALLATIPEATWDESFTKLRAELEEFNGIKPAKPPKEFVGELRHYQEDGLGWLGFLRRFGFGGCLADDMGLGKTVQLLAMLQQRKSEDIKLPSLVVVPRSLIFNWVSEAQKFTPGLRVLDHSGAQRSIPKDGFKEYDIVLSTYGTIRRDAAELKDVQFDYVVLDEAQAIKNNQSESAKAVRLLKSDYRLALSGTPVQNHMGELWSLFEFLNPGLLGAASAFKTISGGAVDNSARDTLGKALRPFILRRTKAQVAPELPDKLEQTLVCELDREQRKLYNELREHYRANLLTQVDQQGIGKSKMQILEALLRLRQAACHPGLIDKKRVDESSAKLDALVPQLEEVLEEDHKALVFSQFTSFLSILRKKLDHRGIVYEYLDGKTTDRQARVRRFQNDPDCKLFLISLKAGGLGLNLTAAEYVFLLDPWWNPAVEQQAIDRTHRIGQTRQVFAYRLIAKDTVEEKVLELQKAKRALADAIITADNSLISSMGREELEMLLS